MKINRLKLTLSGLAMAGFLSLGLNVTPAMADHQGHNQWQQGHPGLFKGNRKLREWRKRYHAYQHQQWLRENGYYGRNQRPYRNGYPQGNVWQNRGFRGHNR